MGNANVWAPAKKITGGTLSLEESFIAEAAQTVFSIDTFLYAIGSGALDVYVDGIKLPRSQVVETSNKSFTLLTPATLGQEILACAHVGIEASVLQTTLAEQLQPLLDNLDELLTVDDSADAALASELAAKQYADAAALSAIEAGIPLNSGQYILVNQALGDKVTFGALFDDADAYDVLLGKVYDGTATPEETAAVATINQKLGLLAQ